MANDQDKGFAAATGVGLTVATTILQNQAYLLRLWADNVERFAQFCESGTEALRSRVDQAERERAA